MGTRLRDPIVRRPSLPLTAADEQQLQGLRESPESQAALEQLTGASVADPAEISEAALLHAIFKAGLRAVRHYAEEAGYAQLAEQNAADDERRRSEARRREPSWAGEA